MPESHGSTHSACADCVERLDMRSEGGAVDPVCCFCGSRDELVKVTRGEEQLYCPGTFRVCVVCGDPNRHVIVRLKDTGEEMCRACFAQYDADRTLVADEISPDGSPHCDFCADVRALPRWVVRCSVEPVLDLPAFDGQRAITDLMGSSWAACEDCIEIIRRRDVDELEARVSHTWEASFGDQIPEGIATIMRAMHLALIESIETVEVL